MTTSGSVDLVEADRITALVAGHSLRKASRESAAEIAPHSPPQLRALWTLLSAESTRTNQSLPEEKIAEPLTRARAPAREVRPSRAEEAPKPTADELLLRAEAERKQGHIAQARALYRQATALPGLDSEVAALRLVRLEVEAGEGSLASAALEEYRARFSSPRFEAEAGWLSVRTYQLVGRNDLARREAAQIIARFPDSAQARAARSYLERKP